jgi:hypothetical protein
MNELSLFKVIPGRCHLQRGSDTGQPPADAF